MFGLTLSRIVDLANEVPDLIGDVKKAEPLIAPLLDKAAALLESPELQKTLTTVSAALAAPETAKVMSEIAGLAAAATAAAPQLAPVIRKVSALLHVMTTTDSPEAASAKLKTLDLPGGADRGGT